MIEHDELIKEKEQMDKMPVGERIRLGKKRRKQQLVYYDKYTRRESQLRPPERAKRLKFTTDVTLLEIASRVAVDEMQHLLKAGTNPNMANHDGLTAMHQCCIDGSIEMVSLLLKAGANVNLTDRDLWTPLHAAATCGHLQICQMLIKAGANLTAVNGDGDMPFDITEDEETLHYLENEMIKRGITQDSIEKARTSFHDVMMHDVKKLIKAKSFLDIPQDQGGTLLHVAISNGFEDIAELLMKNGASLTAEDEDGWQPIHVAAFWGMGQLVDLLTREYSVNLRARTHLGETPYELCDDLDLKGFILDILNENPIETDNEGHEFEEERNSILKTVNNEISENTNTETLVDQDKLERKNSDTGSDTEEHKDNEKHVSSEIQEIGNEEEVKTHPIVNDHLNERMIADRRGSMKEIKLNASFRARSNSDLAKRIKANSQNRTLDGINNNNEASYSNNYVLQDESSNAEIHSENELLYNNETDVKENLVTIPNQIYTEQSTNLQTVEVISSAYSESFTNIIDEEEIRNISTSSHAVQNDINSSQSDQSEDSDKENNDFTNHLKETTTANDYENENHSDKDIHETTVKKYDEKSENNSNNEIYETTVNKSDEIYETTVNKAENNSNNVYYESISEYESIDNTQGNYENSDINENIYENESKINNVNIISELTPPPTPPRTNTSPVVLRKKTDKGPTNSNSNNNNTTIATSSNSNEISSDIIRRNKPSPPQGLQRNSLLYIKWERQQNRVSQSEVSKEPMTSEYSISTQYTPTMFQPPMDFHRYSMNPSEFVGKKKKKKKKDNFVKKQKACVVM